MEILQVIFGVVMMVVDFLTGGTPVVHTAEPSVVPEVRHTSMPGEVGDETLSENAYVLYTVDGDTIAVLVGSSTVPERLRLIGVDTPETFEGSGRDTCYGEEAKKYTRELLTKKSVTLVADSSQDNKDKYGRLLRYVFLDSKNVNEQLVAEGYAREYTFKGIAHRYQQEFQAAEQEAQAGKKGLWAMCE